jgi:ribA/ribD-fused uncharacterized protein
MDIIAFQGRKDVFSNMFPCKLTKYQKTFHSAEHLYQYEKALFHNLPKLSNAIFNFHNGFIAKKLSKSIKISPKWISYREQCLKEILILKAKQCETFKSQLILSGNKTLLEANKYDRYWSCGLDKINALNSQGDYPGKNRMGRLLMTLRDSLLNKTIS